MYDPRLNGARCDECPLNGCNFVPPERPAPEVELATLSDGGVAFVGETPSENDEKQGRIFVGQSGGELDKALRMAGIRRRDVQVNNVLLCRPPGAKLEQFLTGINKKNQEAVKAAKNGGEVVRMIPNPIDCCRPRLLSELTGYTNIVTLGKVALKAITKTEASLMAVRGGLMEVDLETVGPVNVLPTVHPSMILHQMRWAHVFRNDITKAGRWFRGTVNWNPPRITYHPDAETLRRFLSTDEIKVVDVETDGIEPLTAKIRCVGIGNATDVMVCGFLGKDGYSRFYSYEEELLVRVVLAEYLTDPSKVKAGHNIGYYDLLVIFSQWGIKINPLIDTMLIHKGVESELPHGLAYAASMYTEAPAWKSDREGNKLSTDAETDAQLHEYNGMDVAINARIIPPLVSSLQLRNQVSVWHLDQSMQRVCADMHRVGMYVDQERRLEEEKRLLKRRYELLTEIRDRIEAKGTLTNQAARAFNPGSVQQLSHLLFERWALTPPLDDKEALTSSGDPSTADIVLRSLLMDPTVPGDIRDIIKCLRYFRKVQKVLGTYVVKLRLGNLVVDDDLGWDDDDDWVDKETRKRYGLQKMGVVNPRTGRVYPGWSAHVAVTGRLSSSKPINAMNFPVSCRSMVCAAPGNVLVGADSDQIEVRVASALWKIERYLQAFRDGKDPHSMTAFMIFGEAFCKAAGIDPACFDQPGILVGAVYKEGKFGVKSGEAYDLRHLAKVVHFSSQYMAGVERAHKIIAATEVPRKGPDGKPLDDGTTELPYALLPLKDVRRMRGNWLKGVPEYEHGWNNEIETWRRQGYLTEPVTGRRRDFLDGENPNEIVNFPVQASAAGLMNLAMLELHEQIPAEKWGPGTGIIGQVHDWIGVECPEREAENVARMLENCMNRTHPALEGVKFTASAAVGHRWSDV